MARVDPVRWCPTPEAAQPRDRADVTPAARSIQQSWTASPPATHRFSTGVSHGSTSSGADLWPPTNSVFGCSLVSGRLPSATDGRLATCRTTLTEPRRVARAIPPASPAPGGAGRGADTENDTPSMLLHRTQPAPLPRCSIRVRHLEAADLRERRAPGRTEPRSYQLERQPELRKLICVPAVAGSGCQAGSWTGSFLSTTRACVPSAWITISLSGGEPQSP